MSLTILVVTTQIQETHVTILNQNDVLDVDRVLAEVNSAIDRCCPP